MITLRSSKKLPAPRAGWVLYALRNITSQSTRGFVSIMGQLGLGKSKLLTSSASTTRPGAVNTRSRRGRAQARQEEALRAEEKTHRIRLPKRPPSSTTHVSRTSRFRFPTATSPRRNASGSVSTSSTSSHRREQRPLPETLSAASRQLSEWPARALQALASQDEPTGNLHSEQGREIMSLFKKRMRKARRSSRSRTPRRTPPTAAESSVSADGLLVS